MRLVPRLPLPLRPRSKTKRATLPARSASCLPTLRFLSRGWAIPANEYARNRHNAGFIVADEIHAHYRFGPWNAKFEAFLSEGTLAGRKVYLLKPQTYMNNSGVSVGAALRFFKLPLSALVVIHDEIDLAAGKIKVKTGGGDAGQNGLRSITATLGPDYRRVRVGVGHPGEKSLVSAPCAAEFLQGRHRLAEAAGQGAMVEAAPLLAQDDDAGFMTKVALVDQAETRKQKARRKKAREKESRRIMGFKCGIVGLPNVGKSTLFNALTQTAAAQAANYPFCTIEPNVGDVAVPDPRLDTLAKIASSAEIIPTRITFVDIAGLVRGASKGEGLGNQFLATIREVDAVAHVLRCFEDDDITHVEGRIDPIGDAEVVETELMLADLESLEKRIKPLEKKANSGEKEAKEQLALMMKAVVLLREGKPARLAELSPEERGPYAQLGLMTAKPVLYVCQCRGRRGGRPATNIPSRWKKGQGRRRPRGGDLGQGGRGNRAAARTTSARISWIRSDWKSPGSIA